MKVKSIYDNNPLLQLEWLCKDSEGKPISTFFPEVIEILENKHSVYGKISIRLKLYFNDDESSEVIVLLSELDRINWFEKDYRCIINPNYRKAKEYIANIIRAGMISAPTKTQYLLDKLGIERIDNQILFVAGDRVITRSSNKEAMSNFELAKNAFRFDIDTKLTAKETFEGMRELICLSPEIGRVLTAHVISGITRTAFKEAGLIPCAVLIIVGESGMLKSHYVPHMVQLYNRKDEIKAVTRFNSTQCFIEEILYEYSECTAVIDDIHTTGARSIKRINENTAEEIIRRISDDTGRGHKKGNALVQNQFRGNVVFIGEYTIGKESTIPRSLVVNLTKRPDGKILDKYQRQHPLLVSTFYYFFIQWYVDHFDDIRNGIDARLTKFREATENSYIHGRLSDTQFYLQASYMIFLEFCRDSGFILEEDVIDECNSFNSQLAKLIHAQQERFRPRRLAVEMDYLNLIRNLYKNKMFCLAESVEMFNPDKHDGLVYYECLCLRRKNFERKIHYISHNIQIDDVIKDLADKQALKQGKDKYTVKISTLNKGLGSMRFYAIWLSMLEG